MRIGRLDDAIVTFEKALQVDPSFFMSMSFLGYVWALKEDFRQADQWIDRFASSAIRELKAWGFFWKGFYMCLLGAPEKGLAAVQLGEEQSKTAGMKADMAYSNWLRAWICYDRREFDRSRELNEAALAQILPTRS